MATKAESVIDALKTQIEEYFADADAWEGPAVAIEKNSALPEVIPAGGLIIVRDGDPGEEVDPVLGQIAPFYYQHSAEIEVYVEEADQSARDALFSDLVEAIGLALEVDNTLGGEIHGMDYGPAEPVTTPIEGGHDIKSGVIRPVLDYQSNTRL